MRFSKNLRPIGAIVALCLVTGCSSMRPKSTINDPPMLGDATGISGPTVVQAPESRVQTFADRHPLVRRPQEYYDATNGNKLTRTAAAAVIGVPSGIGAEIKQIVVGQAPTR